MATAKGIKTVAPKTKMPSASAGLKLPGVKPAPTKAVKLPTTGIKGYLAASNSKLLNKPKPPKNGLPQSQ